MGPDDKQLGTGPLGPLLPKSARMNSLMLWMESRNSAPGQYGIPGKVLTIAADILHKKIMEILNACIDTGSFPKIWNTD